MAGFFFKIKLQKCQIYQRNESDKLQQKVLIRHFYIWLYIQKSAAANNKKTQYLQSFGNSNVLAAYLAIEFA